MTEEVQKLKPADIDRCYELLTSNFIPYDDAFMNDDTDDELRWCVVKNRNLLKNEKFRIMYSLDRQNRTELLKAIEKQKQSLNGLTGEKKVVMEKIDLSSTKEFVPSFMEFLNPMNGSAEETLCFIKQKTSEANFEFDIFSIVARFPNGKNQYGLNGCIAAVIDFFYQLGYFKPAYSLEQIFKAYSSYTGNTIGKLKVFISEFRYDNSYIRHTAKLKVLKIK